MLLLAFDTATPAVTVALHNGTHALAEVTTIDARRHGELLTSAIDQVLTRAGTRTSGPSVGTPAAVAAEISAGTPVAGAGALLYPDLLGGPGEPGYPAAATLARLAADRITAGLPGLGADPVYLRRPDARVPGPPKRVTVP